ncbi:MAG: manganese efflux pump [Oscillospiraceae bacterium]|nr:manganese efflux pump [Oscillospiraceae bacterium]
MDFSVEAIIQASALSLSLSLDAFAAAFAYGCTGTKIPFGSVVVINLVCTAFLGLALFAGDYASGFISPGIGVLICFSVLMLIGGFKLFQSLFTKPVKCGKDSGSDSYTPQKSLLPFQAAIIAAALSLDGIAAGFGAALGGVNSFVMLGVSLTVHMAAVPLGGRLGGRLSKKTTLNISWLGGAVIIILAFTKLL